jgi:hypothetical protein
MNTLFEVFISKIKKNTTGSKLLERKFIFDALEFELLE